MLAQVLMDNNNLQCDILDCFVRAGAILHGHT